MPNRQLRLLMSHLGVARHAREGTADCRTLLGRQLLEVSYRRGNFTLTSGKNSDFYIDGKKTILNDDGAFYVGMVFCDMIEEFNRTAERPIEAVAGMTLGADPLVTATSVIGYLRGMSFSQIIIRKEAKMHGTGQFLEIGSKVPPGCSVALLEDVVTTAGTLEKAISRLESQDFHVGLIATIVDREEGGRQNLAAKGYELRAVFTRTEMMAVDGGNSLGINKDGEHIQA